RRLGRILGGQERVAVDVTGEIGDAPERDAIVADVDRGQLRRKVGDSHEKTIVTRKPQWYGTVPWTTWCARQISSSISRARSTVASPTRASRASTASSRSTTSSVAHSARSVRKNSNGLRAR